MAGICRSAVLAGAKSLASRSKTLIPKAISSKPLPSPFSSSPKPVPCASRILSALGSVESLMPLHSAVASARLKSFIAVDSTTWSWLSQGTMNIATLFYKRVNIKELVTNMPVYRSASDIAGEGLSLTFMRWATKKTAGSTKNGRDSKPKNLGVKKFGGERVIPGNIIIRQRGTRFHPGNYVGIGKDHTLYALKEGCVKFEKRKLSGRKWVHVEPKEGHTLHPVYTDAAAPRLKTAV